MIRIDSRLKLVGELINYSFRALKYNQNVALIDLVPVPMRARPAVLNNFIDIVSFLGIVQNVPEASSRYLRVMRNNISVSEVERRVNAVQTILWYAISHYGYPAPQDKRAELINQIGSTLQELQFPRSWDKGVIACLSLTEIFGSETISTRTGSNVIRFPKGNMALEEEATHIVYKGDERDLDDSLEQFFQIPRYRDMGAILHKAMADLKWAQNHIFISLPQNKDRIFPCISGRFRRDCPM